jgi:O-antigen ligase
MSFLSLSLIGSNLNKVGLTVVYALACLSTLLIAVTPEWPLWFIQSAIVAIFMVACIRATPGAVELPQIVCSGSLLFIGVWGAVQIGFGLTAYRYATIVTTLQWFTLWAVFMLLSRMFCNPVVRDRALLILTVFASVMAVATIAGGLLPAGRILGLIATTYDRLYGPFQYYNNAAAFFELAFPIPLYGAIAEKHNQKALAAGLLYSAILITGSRTGAILATLEILLVAAIAVMRSRKGLSTLRPLGITALVAITISFSASLLLHERFEQQNPLAERMDLNRSSFAMATERPLMGFGLGTYPTVYPAYARFDAGRFVNHAHNDWAEWTVEGGVPLLLAMLILAFTSAGRAIRSGWGIGLLAVFVHALVDYPFQRFGVAIWIIVILAGVSTCQQRAGDRFAPRPINS